MIESVKLLTPELILSGAGLLLLLIDAFAEKRNKLFSLTVSLLALLGAAFCLISMFPQGRIFGLLVLDPFSLYFKLLAIFSAVMVLLLSEKDGDLLGSQAGSYASLILFSTVGMMFLCSAEDLLMLFVGLELTTVPLFVLAGFTRNIERSSEGAIKFFLIGAFSTGLMLFGISYLYGICGSTHFVLIRQWFMSPGYAEGSVLFLTGILFLLVGLGFKLSLVPFHQWTPDAYEGAPTPVTAFFSASREAGVIVIMLRFFSEFVNQNLIGLTGLFGLLAILTMTVGNITAMRQDNLKRILAYSSIAHAGTIFIGLVAGNQLGREGVMLYSLTYFLMSLGAFAVVIVVSRIRDTDDLVAVQGLAKENFPLAFIMLFFLLSLAGIPPLLGFWGKFYVFAAAIQSKMYALVAIGLLNSVIAVYYYFRIIHKMFFENPPEHLAPIPAKIGQFSIQLVTTFAAAVLIFFGLFPQEVLSWVKGTAQLLP